MRKLIWLSVLVVFAGAIVGCSGGGGASTAEDDKFQKDLADAAAKNKNGPAKRSGMPKPPPIGGAGAPAAPGGSAPGGSAPGN